MRLNTALAFTALLGTAACDQLARPATGSSAVTDATLSALVVSAGTLTPAFRSDSTAYTLAVTNSVGSLTVTPTATAPDAVVVVNGSVVASGAASPAIALPVGTTPITVRATAPDGATSRTYSISATRAP